MENSPSAPSAMPIVGVTANVRRSDANPNIRLQSVGENYGRAVSALSGAMPLYLPPLGEAMCIETLLSTLDGLLLTGGRANVEPHHYGQAPAPGEDERDPGRDHLVLPLIRRAIEIGLPVLGICRGIQEMNVALGGTLHQRLHEVPGREDHRRRRDIPWADSMAPRHRLRLTPGGVLAEIAGAETAEVNSLHGQGVDAVAQALRIEAWAEDGTIEAVSLADGSGFALGVQWHAEYRAEEHDLYRGIFHAFGAAVRQFATQRRAVHRVSTVGQVA